MSGASGQLPRSRFGPDDELLPRPPFDERSGDPRGIRRFVQSPGVGVRQVEDRAAQLAAEVAKDDTCVARVALRLDAVRVVAGVVAAAE